MASSEMATGRCPVTLQYEKLVALTARAFRTIFGVPHRAFQQRAPQQLARDRQFAHQLTARTEGLLSNHLQA